jgi:hypothetical protein
VHLYERPLRLCAAQSDISPRLSKTKHYGVTKVTEHGVMVQYRAKLTNNQAKKFSLLKKIPQHLLALRDLGIES